MDTSRRSCRTAGDLPIEWVAQILSFLPLAQQFACKSVCRKWFLAANQSLADQDEVTFLRDRRAEDRNKDRILYLARSGRERNAVGGEANSLIDCWTRQNPQILDIYSYAHHLLKSMSCFKNLKEITIDTTHRDRANDPAVTTDETFEWMTLDTILRSLIVYNSGTLVKLDAEDDMMCLPYDERFPTTYPRLRELICHSLTEGHLSCFPRLRKLSLQTSMWLQNLPDSMEELCFRDQ